MQLFILIVLAGLIIGLVAVLRFSGKRKVARGVASPSPAPSKQKAGAKPRRERVNPNQAIALGVHTWRFHDPPPGARYGEIVASGDTDMSEVMARAEGISGHLQARQNVLAGVSGKDFNPKQVSELVTGDPALAAQVLRIVNSPYYGLSQKVGSVFRAVVLLGHVEVRNIIWRACVSDGLDAMDKRSRPLVEGLWQHSFATSKVAYALARELNLPEPDKLATTALLHDIGKLISLNVWPESARNLYDPIQFSAWDVVAEETKVGAHHAQLGAEVARAWGLPDDSVRAIAQHHAPSYLPTSHFDSGRKSIAAVHLADLLVHACAPPPPDGEGEEPPVYRPLGCWLNLLGLDAIEDLCTPMVMAALPRRQPAPAPSPDSEQAELVPVD